MQHLKLVSHMIQNLSEDFNFVAKMVSYYAFCFIKVTICTHVYIRGVRGREFSCPAGLAPQISKTRPADPPWLSYVNTPAPLTPRMNIPPLRPHPCSQWLCTAPPARRFLGGARRTRRTRRKFIHNNFFILNY